jgi:hypothetical protein
MLIKGSKARGQKMLPAAWEFVMMLDAGMFLPISDPFRPNPDARDFRHSPRWGAAWP